MPSEDQGGTRPQDATLAALLGQLFRDAETLLLQELALFRAELGENAGRLAGGAIFVVAGVAVALIGGLALVGALIVVLGAVMPFWLASALVGAVFCGSGAALILYGRRLIARASLLPRQTWHSLRETGEWLGDELR
jgi:Putative Actinobacterial Holin-X, holin superfamily III